MDERIQNLHAAIEQVDFDSDDPDPAEITATATIPSQGILLRVRGTTFHLDPATMQALQSDFLNTLTNPESPFRKPDSGVYSVDANPEYFSALLHMLRFGSLPCNMIVDDHKERMLLQEAAFWGLDESLVQAQLKDAKSSWKSSRRVLKEAMHLSLEIEKSKMHHNFRANDGHGCIYCLHCGNRDTDDQFSSKSSLFHKSHKRYSHCKTCRRTVNYQPNLGWCHKCRLCIHCQVPGECPADDPMTAASCERPAVTDARRKSTRQLREELERFTDSVAF